MTYQSKNSDREKLSARQRSKSEKDNHKSEKFPNYSNSSLNEKENTSNNITNDNIFGFKAKSNIRKRAVKRKALKKDSSEKENLKQPKVVKYSDVSEKASTSKHIDRYNPEISNRLLFLDSQRSREMNNRSMLDYALDKKMELEINNSGETNEDFLLEMEAIPTELDGYEPSKLKADPPSYTVTDPPDIYFPSVVSGMLLSCRVIDRSTGSETNLSPCIVTRGQKQEPCPRIYGAPQPTHKESFSTHQRGYHFIKLLRDCIYGKVYIAKTLDWSDYYQQFVYSEESSFVAIKCIDRSKLDYPEFNLGGTGVKNGFEDGVVKMTTAEDAIREISLLQQVSFPGHENIQEVTDVIMDVNCVYLISPYYSGGELFNHVDNVINKQKLHFSQEQVKKYMREILSGVRYLHRKMKVCHHDLSLENILLDDKGSAIIIDFGMACKLPDDEGKVGFSFQDSTKEKESICSLRSLSNEKRDDILLDNVSIVTDKTAFFDFEEDFVQRRQKRNRSFYNQLSDFFSLQNKPETKVCSSILSESTKSTKSGEHISAALTRISTPDTIDVDIPRIFDNEYEDKEVSDHSFDVQVTKRYKIKSRGARIGKITYMTPEIWNNEDFNGEAIDMWACGVILFILLVGFPPMEEPNEKDNRFNLIMKGQLHVLLNLWGIGPDIVPSEALDLINKLVRRNPWERLSVEEALAHPYLKTD